MPFGFQNTVSRANSLVSVLMPIRWKILPSSNTTRQELKNHTLGNMETPKRVNIRPINSTSVTFP